MTRPDAVLSEFRSVDVGPLWSQQDALDYAAWLFAAATVVRERNQSSERAASALRHLQRLWNRFGVSPKYIRTRQLAAMPPFEAVRGATPPLPSLYSLDEPEGPTAERRLSAFTAKARELFTEFYLDRPQPDDIVHVTCTGYESPSAAQRYVVDSGWLRTSVTHCYHLGCYAAIPALRIASSYGAWSFRGPVNPLRAIDVVHTEWCSLHYPSLGEAEDPEQIVAASLFADGCIGYRLTPVPPGEAPPKPAWRLRALADEIIPDTQELMTWRPGSHRFVMTLSIEVPLAIQRSILGFVERLCSEAGLGFAEEREGLLLAIHPGGPKIIDLVAAELGLQEEQTRWSRQVLREHGNMSSATLPHIWQAMLQDPEVRPGDRVVTVAMGPGLTVTGAVLEKLG